MFPIRTNVPTRHEAFLTWLIIAANAVIFLFEESLSANEQAALLYRFALLPARYQDPSVASSLSAYWPLLTSTFLHGGWLHLIVNMWALALFGPAIEDRLGHARFLLFYLACGVAGSLTYLLLSPSSNIPVLGASGAIAGVLGSYTLLFPFARVIVLVPILFLPLFFSIPAIVFTLLWLATQLLSGVVQLFSPEGSGGIAWWAHVGGFVAGLLLTPPLLLSNPLRRPYHGDEGVLGFAPPQWK
jgi:membrane associated rhomboid family serine protease